MNVQPCNKCKCPIKWDMSLEPPFKRDKKGWWMEDLAKVMHNQDRCKQFQTSKEFFENEAVHNAQTNPNVQTAPSPLKVKEMDVADFAEPALRSEIKVHTKFLMIIEDEVSKILGKDVNPARLGLYINNVRRMLQK